MDKGRTIEVLDKWNFWNKDIDTGIDRQVTEKIYNSLKYNKIITITGIRRSGKSYIVRQLIKKLIGDGLLKENTLFVNFEEPFFEDIDLKKLTGIYEAYNEIIKPKTKPYLFLDEIQVVDGWERFARSLNEKGEANIVITGSSSKLMSDELATVLTGRQITYEIFPLSFNEFLTFNKIKINTKKDIYINADEIRKHIWNYVEFGGFPEIVLIEDTEIKTKIILEYYSSILNSDIINRYQIRSIDKIKKLAKFYISSIGSPITYRNLDNFLKIPTETISRFSNHLQTAKLIFFIDCFSFSFKKQHNYPRKIYCTDNGFFTSVGFRFMENRGRLIENTVAIELKRRQASDSSLDIYYWKNDLQEEVDFVIKDGLKVKQLIQVCYNMDNPNTRLREIKAMLKASSELKCSDLLIITWDYEAEEEHKGKKITFIPLWKWLLSSS